jgi:plasmid stability protein
VANVTLVIDDDVLQKARVKAVHQLTSVNAVIRDYLAQWIRDDDERTRLAENVGAHLAGTDYRSGGVRWTRDELHER